MTPAQERALLAFLRKAAPSWDQAAARAASGRGPRSASGAHFVELARQRGLRRCRTCRWERAVDPGQPVPQQCPSCRGSVSWLGLWMGGGWVPVAVAGPPRTEFMQYRGAGGDPLDALHWRVEFSRWACAYRTVAVARPDVLAAAWAGSFALGQPPSLRTVALVYSDLTGARPPHPFVVDRRLELLRGRYEQ